MGTLTDQLCVLSAIRVMKMRSIAGFIVLRLKPRFHTGTGQPLNGSPSAVAHLAATAPRRSLVTAAVAARSRDVLQPGRNVGVQVCLSPEQQQQQSEQTSAEEPATDCRGKLAAHA
jgi:hypothetical protein